MNALFATQALGLRFHDRLRRGLAGPLALDRVGFYVSDSAFYQSHLERHPDFPTGLAGVVKEWEVLAAAARLTPDRDRLAVTERRLGTGPLWDGLLCDRRIMLGPWCKEFQDYRPRFTHERMLAILQAAVETLEALFDAVTPAVTFGFVPVTFGEYLCYQIAEARGVPQMYLYPTKIENYMAWMSSFFGRPDHIVEAYEDFGRRGCPSELGDAATRYVRETVKGLVRHEGMILVPAKRAKAGRRGSAVAAVRRLVRAERRYWGTETRHDNHVRSPTMTLVHKRLLGPLKTRAVRRRLAPQVVTEADLARLDFAFHPLHAEPEVALSIHGKPYVNQIETVRNVARSLPVGMQVVVKEHPRCIGYRPAGYYRKLLQIPNVRLADPNLESKALIERARLVTTVWSFVGFESVLYRTPVVVLGTPLYGLLPPSMVRHVTDLNRLPAEIADLLEHYAHDEQAVVRFVAACMQGGVRIDFYARFIDKAGRHVADDGRSDDEQFDRFVEHTVSRVRDVMSPSRLHEATAR